MGGGGQNAKDREEFGMLAFNLLENSMPIDESAQIWGDTLVSTCSEGDMDTNLCMSDS